ncbi:MAG: TonB-dependent receptor domain-containing protein [Bryobacteraceae bacterium]
MQIFRAALLAALTLCYPTALLFSQVNATGTFSGQVNDATGAAVPNAAVKVTEQGTGIVTSKQTASDGYFTVALLKPGIYSIEVSASGFSTAVRKDVTLQIQQVIQEDFTLQVGNIQQQVTVEGGAPLLNTESTELGSVLTEHSTQQLPLNGRNFSQLALLVPGTNPGPVGGIRTQGNGNETQRAGAEIVASGSRGSFNTFMVDGLDDRDQSVGTVKVFPNLESIGEFKVQVGNYSAEFASGGAVVNVITRSGANEFHGSAFEFLRNNAFDARQFFDAAKPQFQQNQFGGALGGPIKRNKTFFFGDYQGLRIHSASTSLITEPTAAMRAGNFAGVATLYDPTTYNSTTNTRQLFAGNLIPGNRIDPIARNLLALFPLPNLPGNRSNVRLNNLGVQVQDQYDVRVDQTFSDTDSMFVRYTHGDADLTFPNTPVLINGAINPLAFAQGSSTAGSLRLNHAPSDQATIQEIHQFSPSVVNQLALGYTRFALRVTPLDFGFNIAQRLGLQGANTDANSSSMASLTISGYQGSGASNLPEVIPQNTYQISDTISYTKGAHSFRFGGSVINNRFGFYQLGAPAGSLSFSGVYTNNPANSAGGNGFADFLLGLPLSSSKSAAPSGVPYEHYTEYGAFAQDTWRATSKLTVNLGLRYDLFTPLTESYNRQSDFLLGSGTLVLAGQNGYSRSIVGTQKHNVSPRVGLAYRVDDRTVVRAAYGLFYFNEVGTGGSARLFINYPFAAQYAVNCSATAPCLNTSTGIPNTLSSSNLPTVVYMPIDNLTPNIQQWNFTVERQVGSSWVFSTAYVGTRGTHLNIALDENVAFPGPGSVPARRPYPNYATISAWEPRGPSSYNGLQTSAQKRLSQGISLLAAYTYSKSLDEGAGGNSSTGENRNSIQNPRNLSADYGLSNFNYKQRFTLSTVIEMPFGHGRKFLGNARGIQNALIGGWQVSSIVTIQSGAPFSPILATATANTGTFNRPDRVCDGNLPGDQQTLNAFYNVSCFKTPAQYTFGNAGRNILIGPGLGTWDLGAGKDFLFTEKAGIQFRSEFFNVLNRANFGLPDRNIGSATQGTITSVITNARQIQFALRFHF